MQMLCAGVVVAVAGLASGEAGQVQGKAFTAEPLLAFGYLVVFGSLLAFSAYAWLLKNVRISTLATYAFVNPVVAVALGAGFLGEPITWTTLIAGGAIVLAVVLIVSAKAPTPRPSLATRRAATLTS
jgi:drug/metabolite transporter (DMT)-like permease